MKRTEDVSSPENSEGAWWHLLLVLCLLLPLAILFLLPGGGMFAGGLWFWFTLLLTWLFLWMILGRATVSKAPAEPEPRILHESDQPPLIRELMNVRMAEEEEGGVRVFRGRLRESAEEVLAKLKNTFGRETVPMVQEDERTGSAILLLPRWFEKETLERKTHAWVNWLLFLLTILTTTWAGAAHRE